ncbi:MAG: general secretion pathway protein GspB [Nevskiales bacterium]
MSFILDALRKAERERNLGQVPALRISAAPTYSAPRGLLPWWTVAIAAVVVLGVGLFWWWRTQADAEPATLAAAPAVTPQAPTAAPIEPPPTPLPTQRVEVQTPQGPVEVEIPKPATPPAQPPVSEISEQPLAPESTPPAPVEEVAPEDLPALEQMPGEEAPIEEIGPSTPELPPEEPLVQDLPSYNGLPENIRAGIAQLDMNAHVYSSTPGRGFVMINGKKYRQGDQLAEGPEVVQILPDSVVLRYRGTDFLLPVPR